MEKAIKIAIENGWQKEYVFSHLNKEEVALSSYETDATVYLYTHQVCLDSLFWQALERGLKWGETSYDYERHERTDWKWHWHRFIDHLAEGGDIDSFFEYLIN